MHKLFALCTVLVLVLNACANDTHYEPNASGPAGVRNRQTRSQAGRHDWGWLKTRQLMSVPTPRRQVRLDPEGSSHHAVATARWSVKTSSNPEGWRLCARGNFTCARFDAAFDDGQPQTHPAGLAGYGRFPVGRMDRTIAPTFRAARPDPRRPPSGKRFACHYLLGRAGR